MLGECTLVRFADDFVMTFKNHRDAKRVLEVLGKRLARYGLTLHPDKTRFVDFRPERKGGTHPDCAEPPFDFLGFTHTWAKSLKGQNVVRQRTAKSRLARALLGVKEWCRFNRHLPILDQHKRLSENLVGHYAYYGITGNSRQLATYAHQIRKGCGGSGWNGGRARSLSHGSGSLPSSPAIPSRGLASSISTPLLASLSHEEPEAVILHVRVRGG